MGGDSRRWVAMGVAFFGLLAMGLGAVAYHEREVKHRQEVYALFKPHLRELGRARGFRKADTPYWPGRAIVLDERGIDTFYFDHLPRGMRAARPEEVRTVIHVSRSHSKAGTFRSGSYEIVSSCRVTLVDVERRLIVDRREFRGEAVTANEVGSDPDPQLLAYLKGLLRKDD